MDFRVLGPLEVRSERGAVHLGGPKPRAVLAVLLLHANEPVSSERLVEAVWGEEESYENRKSLQVSVSRLRKALGEPGIVATKGKSYEVRVRPGSLTPSASSPSSMTDDARWPPGMPRRRRPPCARGSRSGAGRRSPIWRSSRSRTPTSRGSRSSGWPRSRRAWKRTSPPASTLRWSASCDSWWPTIRPGSVSPDNSCWRSTATAGRWRRSRNTAALARRLVEEIGVEPGPELRRLHEAILRQHPSLEPPAPRPELPQRARRHRRAAARRARRRARLAARALGAGQTRQRLARHDVRPARDRQKPARRRAGRRRPSPRGHGAVRGRGRSRRRRPGHARATHSRQHARRCWWSTMRIGADEGVLGKLAELTDVIDSMPVLALATGERREAFAPPGADGALDLGPLDAEAVREIAAPYASDPESDEVPVDWLLETSEGLPRRIHELASQWARHQAARRVDQIAERTESGRAELRSMENELAGGVVELQRADERLALVDEQERPVVCPFKGLAPFDVDDAEYFFGRERLVAELVAQACRDVAAGRRRTVGKRQVLGRPGRPAARPCGRRAARQRQLQAGGDPSRRASAARATPRLGARGPG